MNCPNIYVGILKHWITDMLNGLESNLKQMLGWHKCHIECLIQIMLGLIAVRTVNLKELACVLSCDAKLESNYRKLQRFFTKVSFDKHSIALLMINLFFEEEKAFYLAIDRTNWRWGKKDINILMLSACYQGASIPLYWVTLNKFGNSDTKERIALMDDFLNGIGVHRIAGFLGDREFIGMQWLSYLITHKIPFDMRVKKDHITTNSRGMDVDICDLFYDVTVGNHKALNGKRKLMGVEVYLSASRLADGELLILASSKKPRLSIYRYAMRWEIETLFSCLKGRGFNFEQTRITDLNRIDTMVGVLTLTFAWAHKVGDWRDETNPIKVKKHGYLEVSLFRCGLDWIRQSLVGIDISRKRLKKCIDILVKDWTISVPISPSNDMCT